MKIPRKPGHFKCGIDLEEERLVVPVERVRVHANAVIGVLGPAVVLPCGIEIEILAQAVIGENSLAVGAGGQSGDADARVTLVADV